MAGVPRYTSVRTAFVVTALATLGLVLVVPPSAEAGGNADLSVAISGPTAPVRVNEPGEYQITVTNSGPNTSAGTKLQLGQTDTPEPDFGYISVTADSLQPSQGTCKPRPTVCQLGSLGAGASATVALVARAQQIYLFSKGWALQADVDTDNEVTIDPNKANNTTVFFRELVPPVKLRGLPGGCASKPFTLKVRTAVVGETKTKLIVDGKVIEKSAKPKFKARVELDKLKGSKHNVEVVVKGEAFATSQARFKTC